MKIALSLNLILISFFTLDRSNQDMVLSEGTERYLFPE